MSLSIRDSYLLVVDRKDALRDGHAGRTRVEPDVYAAVTAGLNIDPEELVSITEEIAHQVLNAIAHRLQRPTDLVQTVVYDSFVAGVAYAKDGAW